MLDPPLHSCTFVRRRGRRGRRRRHRRRRPRFRTARFSRPPTPPPSVIASERCVRVTERTASVNGSCMSSLLVSSLLFSSILSYPFATSRISSFFFFLLP